MPIILRGHALLGAAFVLLAATRHPSPWVILAAIGCTLTRLDVRSLERDLPGNPTLPREPTANGMGA